MTADTTYAPPPPRDDSVDKGLGLVSYVILFLSPFIAGFPSLISAIIAYVRRGSASPVMRSHYDFQLKIFWIGVLLLVGSVVLGLVALGSGLFGLMAAWGDLVATTFSLGMTSVLLVSLAVLGFVANFFWMLIASVVGLVRLVDGRPIGRVTTTSLLTSR